MMMLHKLIRSHTLTDAKPLIVVVQQPWQSKFMRRVQRKSGAKLCHVDATGQTNAYGYMLYALLYKVLVASYLDNWH